MNALAFAAIQSSFPSVEEDRADPAESHYRHLDRCRRVRVGPATTLVFEDVQTLWFRMQELARVARQAPKKVGRELDWYTRLLPTRDRLLAAVWVSVPGCRLPNGAQQLRSKVAAGRLWLISDAGHEIPGEFLPQRVSDRLLGLVGWVEFRFEDHLREAFLHDGLTWRVAIEADGYQHESAPLSDLVLESLGEDLR